MQHCLDQHPCRSEKNIQGVECNLSFRVSVICPPPNLVGTHVQPPPERNQPASRRAGRVRVRVSQYKCAFVIDPTQARQIRSLYFLFSETGGRLRGDLHIGPTIVVQPYDCGSYTTGIVSVQRLKIFFLMCFLLKRKNSNRRAW